MTNRIKTIPIFLLGFFSSTLFGAQKTANTPGEITSSFSYLVAGDTLTIGPGVHYVGNNLSLNHHGNENAYIVIRAAQKGTATLRVSSGDQMINLTKKYVVFENLTFNGGLAAHCVHIKEGAGNLIFRNCIFYGTVDKAVKNSALRNAAADNPGWQDYQLYENCEAYGGNAEAGGMLNINGVDYLTVRGCYIHDYTGNGYYAALIKAGGQYSVFENNLVKNVKIGLTFGAGKTSSQWHRRGLPEALDGIMRNNVIVNASEVGLHCNTAQNCQFINNTLVNTYGMQNQNNSTGIVAKNNIVMGGSIGSRITKIANYTGPIDYSFFWDALLSDNYRLKPTATPLIGTGQ